MKIPKIGMEATVLVNNSRSILTTESENIKALEDHFVNQRLLKMRFIVSLESKQEVEDLIKLLVTHKGSFQE